MRRKETGQKEKEGEEEKMRDTTDSNYCLWKHLKAFYEQCRNEKTADFGEPCSDCRLWENCKGDWIKKIGKTKPKDIEINVVLTELLRK